MEAVNRKKKLIEVALPLDEINKACIARNPFGLVTRRRFTSGGHDARLPPLER